jgi:hypothetical protein
MGTRCRRQTWKRGGGMIPATDIERARSVRIEDEIARRGITLKPEGAERIGPCPVCGGRNRFSINIRKQVFNCRGAVGGDVIDLSYNTSTDAIFVMPSRRSTATLHKEHRHRRPRLQNSPPGKMIRTTKRWRHGSGLCGSRSSKARHRGCICVIIGNTRGRSRRH